MTRNTWGLQGLPLQDPTEVFDEAQRYRDLLTAVNGRMIQRGLFLVPEAQDTPLGENWRDTMPSGPKGCIDLMVTPGDFEELIGYAEQVGLDISHF